mgnify:CR=1 FL=1
MSGRILVVDDIETNRRLLEARLTAEYFEVECADSGEACLERCAETPPDLILLDVRLGRENGVDLLREVRQSWPELPVIMITAYADSHNAVEAMKLGASDYIHKPFDVQELLLIVERSLQNFRLQEENQWLKKAIQEQYGEIIGESQCMREMLHLAERVAPTLINILVTGESGTGKELVARAIHTLSDRKNRNFVPLNCAAIPEELLESELFGYVKGAFTGATSSKQGRIQFAQGGTLFLDEIGDMRPALQAKLLRVLQEKTFEPVGGMKPQSADVRIISATHRDLSQAIADGEFREDLYYRISVITISLPPLRERGEDILLLANYFLNRYAAEFAKKVKGYSSASEAALNEHSWPGNVREMENRIKRAILLAEGPVLEPCDLGFEDMAKAEPVFSTQGLTLKEARDRLERDMLVATLKKKEGNVARSSEDLGVSRPTFYDLMKKHHLQNG